MNPTFVKAVRHYLAGLISTMWNGGIGAVAGILGVDGVAMSGIANTQALDWRQMLSAFVGACVLHGVFWLKAHPLPDDYETNPPFFPPATVKDPPSSGPTLPTS